MTPISPKLVRDGIIKKIEDKGQPCLWHTAAPRDHQRLLVEKILEEVEELLDVLDDPDRAEEECGDLFETIQALLQELGLKWDDVRARAPTRKPLRNEAKDKLPGLLREAAEMLSTGFLGFNQSVFGDVIRDVEELIVAFGFSRARVVNVQRRKRAQWGGFTKWIVLEAC